MEKQLPDSARSDGTPPPDAAPADAAPGHVVGYRRPPEHTRFKTGHRKLGGRRKGQRNARTAFKETLDEKIRLREGNRPRSLSKRDAIYLRITNDAVSGNDKAQTKVIALMQSHGLNEEPEEATNRKPFTADDEAVIADFLRRQGMQPPENIDKLGSGAAEPQSKQNKETKS